MLMIRNIDPHVQIPGLSRPCTKIPGLSRPGVQIFKFQDFPGFQGPVRTPTDYTSTVVNLNHPLVHILHQSPPIPQTKPKPRMEYTIQPIFTKQPTEHSMASLMTFGRQQQNIHLNGSLFMPMAHNSD